VREAIKRGTDGIAASGQHGLFVADAGTSTSWVMGVIAAIAYGGETDPFTLESILHVPGNEDGPSTLSDTA
jgi:hypothetical protein